jgi:hypothetical protein
MQRGPNHQGPGSNLKVSNVDCSKPVWPGGISGMPPRTPDWLSWNARLGRRSGNCGVTHSRCHLGTGGGGNGWRRRRLQDRGGLPRRTVHAAASASSAATSTQRSAIGRGAGINNARTVRRRLATWRLLSVLGIGCIGGGKGHHRLVSLNG